MRVATDPPAVRLGWNRRDAATGMALAAWLGVVCVAHLWGDRLVHRNPLVRTFAAPLAGRIDPRWGGWRVVPAIAIGAVAVAFAGRWGRTLTWRRLLLVAFGVAVAWAVSLAFVDGLAALTAPLRTRWDYLVDLPKAADPGSFLRAFSSNLGQFSTHVRAHPPGMLLVLRAMPGLGVHGAGAEAVLVVAGGASAVPAAMIALRHMSSEDRTRSAWPFLAIVPAALWLATSADAFFAGVTAWGVALVVLATAGSGRSRSTDVLAGAGGLLLAAAMLLSYGLALAWLLPLGVAAGRRRARPIAVAAAAAGALLLLVGSAGFWWPSGLAAARIQYLHGAARLRPQAYFWFGNLGALALAMGPAWAAGLTRLRDPKVWLLVGGALLAVALADMSGMSKGEVERIWLPFIPWLGLTGAAFDGQARGWLAAQAGAALALQLVVRSPW